MAEEAKGTLKDDVTSISDQGKTSLITLSITATTDVKNKKSKSGKTKKTTVELTEIDGVKYQIVATNEEKSKPRATVEDKIRSIGLVNKVTGTLIEKYKKGEITSNHVRDISKINTIENVTKLASDSQRKLAEIIIENRNIQNDINSSEAAILLLKSGQRDKFVVDTWYRGILRLVQKLRCYAEVSEEAVAALSFEQNSHLSANIKELISKLNALLLLLEKHSKK
ncbi:hypothetical protein HNQ80_004233 [Anaerosolibacter carboniphilus]|uniref:Uncharacterized protein n=1 Tax=Anaerosolibacter carboniphilus TaxID=1417629 RepID=A0A841KXM1_9FIRM|nr:hypothetical protein [Anaerosolibacter carboniphilus]MBB6218093.1 hypothetical protein [Anaerosolibacter carboniphilus]